MITFTRTVPGTYDAATDTWTTPTETTVTGNAVQVRGDADTYRALSLIQSQAPTLLFTPTTYGQLPLPGDQVTWAEDVYTVRDVAPIQPDGVAIMARVIVVR
jgi:hypothetical protein